MSLHQTKRKHDPHLHMAINARRAAFGKFTRHIDSCPDCLDFVRGYLGLKNFCQEGQRLMEDYCYYVTKSVETRE